MFCSGCGSQIQSGLNYCNRCGRRVAETDSESAAIAKGMASSLGYIGGFGFAGFFLVAMVLVKNGFPPGALVTITFFYFAALFGVCYFVAKQAGVLAKRDPQRPGPLQDADHRSYLGPVATAQLAESRETGVGSITDHTTRTLDEVSVERK
jgi:hypothetical protein